MLSVCVHGCLWDVIFAEARVWRSLLEWVKWTLVVCGVKKGEVKL